MTWTILNSGVGEGVVDSGKTTCTSSGKPNLGWRPPSLSVHGAEYDPDGDVQWFHSLAEPELTQDQFLTLQLFLGTRSSWLETPLHKQD